jgi:hypothetical protein
LQPSPRQVQVDLIDFDPTNPGLDPTKSLRDKRRGNSIRDSYDILSRIVYPVIVCIHPDDPKRLMQVDGYGRLSEAKARGQQMIDAIVYPAMTLEERICFRQTLNAAQEPFDAASIIADLRRLASERGLDVTNPDHIKTLLRDMPERVRRYEKDLIMLARLHPSAVQAMGESYRKNGGTIGLDQFRNMTGVMHVIEERHPETVARLGGLQELSLKLSKMYVDKKFSDGGRAQDTLRKVKEALSSAPEDDPGIGDYFLQEKPSAELIAKFHDKQTATKSKPPSILEACKTLMALLVDVDVDSLTRAELRALDRTASVLGNVLAARSA